MLQLEMILTAPPVMFVHSSYHFILMVQFEKQTAAAVEVQVAAVISCPSLSAYLSPLLWVSPQPCPCP